MNFKTLIPKFVLATTLMVSNQYIFAATSPENNFLDEELLKEALLEEAAVEEVRLEEIRLEQVRIDEKRTEEERLEQELKKQAQIDAQRAEEAKLEEERREQVQLQEQKEEERLELVRIEDARIEQENLYVQKAEEAAAKEERVLRIKAEAAATPSFKHFDSLTEMGLPSLSLKLLSQEQAQLQKYSTNWFAYEYEIIKLLANLNQWENIIYRIDSVVSGAEKGKQLTLKVKQKFITDKATANLKLNRADEALSIIRELIWNQESSNNDPSTLLPLWRQLIIRAYLLKGFDDDALKALMKYKIDYQENNPEWNLLQARVLMKNNEFASAASLLTYSTLTAAKPLKFLSSMRAFPEELTSIVKQIRREMKIPGQTKEQLWAYQYVIYLANIQQNSLLSACIELEALLAYGNVDSIMGEEYRVDGDTLWQLYTSIGSEIANKHQMLQGDFEAWFKLANKLKKKSLVSSRSIYAAIAAQSNNNDERQLAHKSLIKLLVGRKDYLELFSQLYLHSRHVRSIENLAIDLRHKMVDRALKERKIKLAAQLMKTLSAAPEGADEFSWDMRKARVMVLQGDYDLGANVLTNSLSNLTDMSAAKIDYFLQVVFDLQSANQHQMAISMFELLRPEWLTDKHKREIVFWKAESFFELNDYARSAMLYIHSAGLVDPTMSDNWAKSARFKAAGALVKAQLYDDAIKVLNDLLGITNNKSSVGIIKQELQKINLLRNAN